MAAARGADRSLGEALGYRSGMRVIVDGVPDSVRHAVERDIDGKPHWLFYPEEGAEAAHLFVTRRSALKTKLAGLRTMIDPAGFVWVSWPDPGSDVQTDLDLGVIRATILPHSGWAEDDMIAIDSTWSAVRLRPAS